MIHSKQKLKQLFERALFDLQHYSEQIENERDAQRKSDLYALVKKVENRLDDLNRIYQAQKNLEELRHF